MDLISAESSATSLRMAVNQAISVVNPLLGPRGRRKDHRYFRSTIKAWRLDHNYHAPLSESVLN
jgi:hypothetical protein